MNTSTKLTLTSAQWKSNALLWGAATAITLISNAILGAAGNVNALNLIITVGVIGFLVRIGVARGWKYHSNNAPFVFDGARTWGVAWRIGSTFVTGRWITLHLANMAESEDGMIFLLCVGLAIMMAMGLILSLHYGQKLAVKARSSVTAAKKVAHSYNEAVGNIALDTPAGIPTAANARIDTRASSQTAPNIAVDTQENGQLAANTSVNTQTNSPVAAIISMGTQTNTRVAISPSTGAQVGDSNTKEGVIGKGKWGMWVGAGLIVVFLGFLGFNYAKQFAPKDAAEIAQQQAFSDAITGDSSVQSSTLPPAPVAVPAPPAALDMMLYRDMQVVDLLKDNVFGKNVIAIVPSASMECVKSTFSSMPALALDSNRNAASEASGSHANNWVEGYVQASPDGQLDVSVVCDDSATGSPKRFMYFTTRGINAALPDGLKVWLNEQSQGEGNVTVFDGKHQKDVAASALVGDLRQNVAGALQPSVAEVAITGDSFDSVGGMITVARESDSAFGAVLEFNGKALADIKDDSMSLQKAYRYGDHDLVLVTHGCSGSSCTYTPFALVEVTASGNAKSIGPDTLVISGDGQVPNIQIQTDASLQISFTGLDGKERWSYANGKLTKEG